MMMNNSELPNGWNTKALCKVVESFIDYRGKTLGKTLFGVPLITAKVVKNNFCKIVNTKKQIKALKQTRDTLLLKLMSGKLWVIL